MENQTNCYCIAIVAPSGYAADRAAYDRAIINLRAAGHTVHDYTAESDKTLRFAASDAARISQLHAAANNPDVDIVMALRGGYGLSRLLPLIDFDLLAQSGKLFVGHSDFTALHLGLLAKTGAVSFAGPMICDDFSRADSSEFTHQHFWQCLSAPACTITAKVLGNTQFAAEGLLWGGNLSMLTHLIGSPWMPQIEGGILFIEDINEHPYRVERMLLQLLHAGILQKQKAVLLGDFSGYRLSDYDNGYDFAHMLSFMRSQMTVPLVQGLQFGHVRDKLTLPVGAQATLRSDAEGFLLDLSGYPRAGLR
jgi:muramoyltetrapeptide carboxypeptidase